MLARKKLWLLGFGVQPARIFARVHFASQPPPPPHSARYLYMEQKEHNKFDIVREEGAKNAAS
jgi:hypothetical protein